MIEGEKVSTYRKYKLISTGLLLLFGLLFPLRFTDPLSVTTVPEDFIKELGKEEFKKIGIVYTPKLLPEGYYIESVELISETEADETDAYSVKALFQNDNGKPIQYIQSKNEGFNQEFIYEHIAGTDTIREKHFYFREGNPENMVFWKNQDGLYIVYATDWTADDLRDFARDIAGNPIVNEN